jgi:hypothetical protein
MKSLAARARTVSESRVGYRSGTMRTIFGQYSAATLSQRSSRTWKYG